MALSAVPTEAQAGPLLDWLRGRCCRNGLFNNNYTAGYPAYNGCNTCQTTPATTTGYTANYAGLQPGQCMTTCNKVCSRTVVNYVPQTAYRCTWQRVPVTTYRPQTSNDPCTGCTVTCMRPCTSYTWQQKQEPYTTYRPVYRQENYTVPVTTITNDCYGGGCSTGACATCPTPVAGQAQNVPTLAGQSVVSNGTSSDGSYYTVPGSTLSTDSGFSTPAADSTPQIPAAQQNYQRPIVDQFPTSNLTTSYQPHVASADNRITSNVNINPIADDTGLRAPSYIQFENRTAESPARERFNYSPVRQASYTSVVETPQPIREVRSRVEPVAPVRPVPAAGVNAGWETVEY